MSENIGKKLRHGIINVFIANIINLIINLLTNFLLPKYLSVDSYAAIKTYYLYVAYAGVLSLGYVDGMFLKYGGIDFKDINKKDLNCNLSTFRIFQITIVAIMLLIIAFSGDMILLSFAFATLPLNMTGYFRSLYQSIGEFKKYSRVMNTTTGATFIINMLLLFGLKTDDYHYYLLSYVTLNILIWIVLEIYFAKSCLYKLKIILFSFKEAVENVKDGILLMLGNFSNIILTSMDRWFIKALMSNIEFAQYSFACSMENFINVAVTPITVTLYNYFCKVNENNQVKRIRNVIILFASALIACAFPGKFVLEIYLTQYIEATSVMFFLFAAQLFYIINKSVYVNLYKARHLQNRYFARLITVIVIGFIFNIICYAIVQSKESFALGTLLASISWLFLSVRDFPEINFSLKEILYITFVIIAFMLCGYMMEAIIGLIVYGLIVVVFSFVLMKSDLVFLLQMLIKMLPIKKKVHK